MLSMAGKEKLETEKIFDYCKSNKITLNEYCNRVLIHIAQEFLQGKLDFTYCDYLMNNIYLLMIMDDISDSNYNTQMVEPAYSIYLAFDEGEFYHPEDDQNIDPSEKYTKPLLIKILKEL